MKRIASLAALLSVLVAAPPAGAKVQRPVRPPAPSPMPAVAMMPSEKRCEQQNAAAIAAQGDSAVVIPCDAAGYFDGTTIWLADPSYRFGRQHELGHVFDAQFMDAGERQGFARLQSGLWDVVRGRDVRVGSDGSDGDPWFTVGENPDGSVTTGYGDLGERFADAYAACRLRLVRAPGHVWETAYGYEPGPSQHRRICRLIANAAEDRGTPAQGDEYGNIWR